MNKEQLTQKLQKLECPENTPVCFDDRGEIHGGLVEINKVKLLTLFDKESKEEYMEILLSK